MKKYYQSKIFWLAIILILSDSLPYFTDLNILPDWLSSIVAILLIVARVWFTNKPIKNKKNIKLKKKNK